MEVMSAPKSVLYGDQLPLGLEAKATKKLFFPTTGDTYAPQSNKTIRIDVNYDGMLDTQQSFLQFTLKNTTAAQKASFDIGQPIIKKLTISSGGVVLEEISDYNTLYSNILFPSGAGDQQLQYERNNRTGINFEAMGALTVPSDADVVTDTAAAHVVMAANAYAQTDGAVATAVLGAFTGNSEDANTAANTTAITNAKAAASTVIRDAIRASVDALRDDIAVAGGATGALHTMADAQKARFSAAATTGNLKYSNVALNADTESTFRGILDVADAAGGQVVCHYKLVSGLLDNDKYLPLVLMNAGITIEIELEDADKCMACAAPASYSVSAVRYVGHTIDLQRDFYDRLRMVQQNSGGVLQIVGQSYRTFRGNLTATTGEQIVNCPARVRSIKSFFFCAKSTEGGADTGFCISKAGHFNLASFQLAIGATRYPPTATTFNSLSNKNGAYTELMKAFGKVGSTTHRDVIGSNGYIQADGTNAAAVGGNQISFAPFGIDLESFRHQIENGIDTSSRALPIQLHLDTGSTAVPTPQDLYMFVLHDTIYYINMDGSVSVSS